MHISRAITVDLILPSRECQCSIHTSLNLAAGLLKAVITLYEHNVIHGDLNPGNVLWIFDTDTADRTLERLASCRYSTLGTLEPFCVKLIDMGANKAGDIEKAGSIRDSWKLYEHMRSFLSPLFTGRKTRFADWFRFELLATEACNAMGAERIIIVHQDGAFYAVSPQQLAGDFFRLICVLTLALGIISNDPSEKDASICLEVIDKRDFYILMYEGRIEDTIKAFSFDSMCVLQKLDGLSSSGGWICWENVWKSEPFCRIDISPVPDVKKSEELYFQRILQPSTRSTRHNIRKKRKDSES